MKNNITKLENGDSVYECKDGRLRVYVKETGKTISYPKYLMERKLGRQLSSNEDVHHKDTNPLNNDFSNLEIRFRGEHQREHSTKYYDTTAVCGWCGKEFLWTGHQQQRFYTERRIGRHISLQPFCSRSCAGHYGEQRQVEKIGESPRRKLSSDQVSYIREHYIPNDRIYGGRALAKRFGVDKTVINLIIKGETYKEMI